MENEKFRRFLSAAAIIMIAAVGLACRHAGPSQATREITV
jgi:hypothetical protein